MEIIVYTDGSHVKGSNVAGYGIHFPNKELPDVSEPFLIKPITHNRAELYAIYIAIKIITDIGRTNIKIYSDSMYSVNSINKYIYDWAKNSWKKANKKPVKNIDIFKQIYKFLMNPDISIQLIHVRAHTGKYDPISIGNDVADRLAVAGSYKIKKLSRSSHMLIGGTRFRISYIT